MSTSTAKADEQEKEIPAHEPLRSSPLIRTVYKNLNRPLWVTLIGGVLVFLISNQVQNHYWQSQQRFLAKQSSITKRLESANATEEEVVRAVGRLLTAHAVLVGAHERRFSSEQSDKSVDEHNRLRDEWDQIEEVLKLKMRLYFPSSQVQQRWQGILKALEALDDDILKLQQFDGKTKSSDHARQAARCRRSIEAVEKELADMSTEMNEYIASIPQP